MYNAELQRNKEVCFILNNLFRAHIWAVRIYKHMTIIVMCIVYFISTNKYLIQVSFILQFLPMSFIHNMKLSWIYLQQWKKMA